MLHKRTHNLAALAFSTLLLATLLLSACGPKSDPAASQPAEQPIQEIPTATPIPPDRAVLVLSAQDDAVKSGEAQALLIELAASSALGFEVRQEISSESITPDVKVVIFLNHPENLGTLAANAPATQFIALSDQDWSPPANVTIVRTRENDAAFLSGYIAATLAPNFRVAALLAAENTAFNQAFQNGALYYCGACASLINPYTRYPLIAIQPAASAAETWQAAFNELNISKVNVLFIAKEALSPQLLSYLSGMDVVLLSNQAPLEEGRARWAASIFIDGIAPMREIWNDVLSGNGGRIVNASFRVNDTQPLSVQDGAVWLSPGKLLLADKMIALLREDQINTQSVP